MFLSATFSFSNAAQLVVFARQVGERLVEHLLEAGAFGVQRGLQAGGPRVQLGFAARQHGELLLEAGPLGAQRRHFLGDFRFDALVDLASEARELGFDLRGASGGGFARGEWDLAAEKSRYGNSPPPTGEEQGLDLHQHGESGYNL